MLVGRSLHGVVNNTALWGDGVRVCSKYTTLNMVVFKYYIGINTKPSETNYLTLNLLAPTTVGARINP